MPNREGDNDTASRPRAGVVTSVEFDEFVTETNVPTDIAEFSHGEEVTLVLNV